jgi:ankyrin repeat protein
MDLLQAVYAGKHDEVAAIRERRPLTLAEAAAVGDVVTIGDVLAEGAPVDERSPDGFTPLQLACHFDHAGAAALLVRRGADLTARATGAMTVQALHAAAASPTGACIPLLLAAGAPLDEAQDGGYTPLHELAMRKLTPLVELLLAAGADPSITADDGRDAAAIADGAGAP